jgi:hypothetical protein
MSDKEFNRLPDEKLDKYINYLLEQYYNTQNNMINMLSTEHLKNDYTASTIMLTAALSILVKSIVINVKEENLKLKIEEICKEIYPLCMTELALQKSFFSESETMN